MSNFDRDCWSCQHLQGLRTVSRAPRIYEGQYWNVEHVPETSVPGWIVIVLRRHAPALHDLNKDEFDELSRLFPGCIGALHREFGTEKEYVMQFAESDHYQHVHFHLVPRAPNWPDELQGPRVFGALGADVSGELTVDEMTKAASKIQAFLTAFLDDGT